MKLIKSMLRNFYYLRNQSKWKNQVTFLKKKSGYCLKEKVVGKKHEDL